uniref:Transposase n=1 Tax=Phytophthora ramorum TaxID=164328 RepID=H3G690_PHYRM
IDEKWFYEDHDKRSYLLFPGEEPPHRTRKSKRFIPKTMLLAAVARPRYNHHRKCRWDGKIGMWPLTEEYVAQRGSRNRPKGTVCARNIEVVDRVVYRDYLVRLVILAIKKKWPRGDRRRPILIQQDNA